MYTMTSERTPAGTVPEHAITSKCPTMYTASEMATTSPPRERTSDAMVSSSAGEAAVTNHRGVMKTVDHVHAHADITHTGDVEAIRT